MYGIISLTLERKSMENLTPKQAKILEFIRNFQAKRGSSPTLREIMERFKFKAIATVQDYLSSLERKGYIKREKDKARSIAIISMYWMWNAIATGNSEIMQITPGISSQLTP